MKYNNYKCKVTDYSGKSSIIFKQGESEEQVRKSFSGSGYIPLEIKLVKDSGNHKRKQNSKSVLEFTQMMEQLIESGLSMKDALEVTSLISKNKKGSVRIAEELLMNIQKGVSFADSINEMEDVFPSVYRGIIKVGDKVGTVEKIFPRLRTYLETNQKIKDKLKGALIYPLIVLFTAVMGVIAMTVFVFPKLQEMFEEFGGEASVLLQRNIIKLKTGSIVLLSIIILLIISIFIIKIIMKKNVNFKQSFDSVLLKIPLIGKFQIYWNTLNFAFAMETLTAGSVTIDNAIPEAQSVITNSAYNRALSEVNKDIMKGVSLSSAFKKHKEFPEYMSRWMVVGEKSGKPDKIFSQIRNYFQNYIDQYIIKIMALIEPALIILVGLIILLFVVTIVVPVFSLYGSII